MKVLGAIQYTPAKVDKGYTDRILRIDLTSLNDQWLSLTRDDVAALLAGDIIVSDESDWEGGDPKSAYASEVLDELRVMISQGDAFFPSRRMTNEIIDDMKGTIQRAYGGLPNSGFVIRADGVVEAKVVWARGNTLDKATLALRPPAWYTAPAKRKKLLEKVFAAGDRLRGAESAEERLRAAEELATFDDPALLPCLGAGLHDADGKVREAAWFSPSSVSFPWLLPSSLRVYFRFSTTADGLLMVIFTRPRSCA